MNEQPISVARRHRRLGQLVDALRGLSPSRGGLWGNQAFLRIWLANAIDDFGTHISGLAIPLTAAITLGAGPLEMGMLAAAQRLPYFALGLFAGVLVDRRARQPLIILVNWLRALVLAAVPVAAVFGWLRIEILYAVAILAGACGIVFDVAYVSWLPSLVDRTDLHDANGKMESTTAAAQAAGPGIAGVLIGWVSAPFAIAMDSLSFVVSALLIRSIQPARPDSIERSAASGGSGGPVAAVRAVINEILLGIQVVWRDVLVRAVVSCSTLVSLFGFIFLAVYILFMTDVLEFSPAVMGLVLAAGGAGAVVGAMLAVRLSQRFGFGPTMIWAQIVFAVMGITVPVAVLVPSLAAPMLAISEFAQYGALAVYNIGQLSLRQARMPDAVQGRATASVRTAVSGAALFGSMLGGLLGNWIGLGETLIVGVIGMALACIVVIASPLRTLRELPED